MENQKKVTKEEMSEIMDKKEMNKEKKISTENETGIIIEVKYAHDGNLESACQEAIAQIRNTRYDDELKENGTIAIL